ncbi:MurR/RpiR family transcriptional regulator [Acidisoma cellulosilytica]|uniref:MurR/RpiR family transcriptional regulator n=1 Tax=Acidisoma cellulosilyticum TaxID=2802395 RepID=A0A963Z233_9PROT|nr:MurR/RpiR family transcriptional regulator [Acidisoma cellulosilyticum]MCB8881109.1 MurR/RpiR family transcriptional regulator [Acidisoma cellulosilyticum]
MRKPVTTGRRVLAELRASLPALSPALARIAETVLEAPERILSQTVIELAEAAGSSDASVIRFCRDQGYESFQGFKLALATELATTEPRTVPSGKWGRLGGMVEQAVTALRETEALLDPDLITTVADRLANARRVLVLGVGASAVTMRYMQYKLTRLGQAAVAHEDAHMGAMAAAGLAAGDVAIIVSSSGSTLDAVRAAQLARDAGAYVVAITNRSRSPLTAQADAVLLAAAAETPLTGGAFASKVSQFLVVDLLFETMARADPATRDAIANTARSVADRGY